VAGVSVALDGGAGEDFLNLDWSRQSGGLNFILNGGAITSNWGSFSSFERFEIHTGSGNDTITTGAANDLIYSGTGFDTVNTGGGNDQIFCQSSGGSFDGGDGSDYFGADFSAQTVGISVALGAVLDLSNGLHVSNVESFGIGGTSGNDSFTVMRSEATVSGGAGFDTLTYAGPATAPLNFDLEVYNGNQLNGSIGFNFRFDTFESLSVTGTQFNDQFRISATYAGQNNSNIVFAAGAGTDLLIGDFRHFTGSSSLMLSADGSISSNRGRFQTGSKPSR